MIDAYDLNQKIRTHWGELSRMISGDSAKKSFPVVPVNVIINGKLYAVNDAYVDSGKIILRTDYENE